MPRRVSLPTADDLFRPTADQPAPQDGTEETAGQSEQSGQYEKPGQSGHGAHTGHAGRQRRRSSGRVRHDEKMTVYVTADELLDLEHARLELRRRHGLAIDRGRLVREAIAIVLADLEHGAEHSTLVQRLTTNDHG